MKIYLAGPMPTQKKWRDKITHKLLSLNKEIVVYNPEFFENTATDATTVNFDKAKIIKSDMVIANITRLSAGTSMEILFAWERNIPVLLIVGNKKLSGPWLRFHSSFLVNNIDEAVEIVRKELI